MSLPYLALGAAIVLEVIGTSLLQKSEQFSRILPTMGMAVCYLISFYLLSVSLKVLPLGVAYAIWSALGVALVAMIGLLVFGQRLDLPAILGLGLIVAGVIVINLFSKTVGH
ncbi:SMR family transporter [Paracoccus sp. 1_MG-2023]|uniref:SMR family transporter n=1 Tax=Paracoccus sp. 1_MG-2023 TaxID=3062651 RepID=UPI001C09C724|nr:MULTISPECIES: SMR family transporter [unclassified Paracoccus (in: a-proteobacteria)]MBU2959058.1 QacE family quaternary ammonium compound efflux SMR transporter [Paracoccus sp. C2R09]MDO6669031.1 SMR family transporter [Paracoccus sp. 1_MG-2023]